MAELNNTENKKNYIPYCLKIRKFKLTKEKNQDRRREQLVSLINAIQKYNN